MKTNPNHLIQSFNHNDQCEGNRSGLTKREYFAAMAMQGLIAAQPRGITIDTKDLAEGSVRMADTLIKALNQNQ